MDLLSYFGKLIPIGEKVTLTGYQFNYMMTLGIAACVIFLGHWMVRHSKFLQKYWHPRTCCCRSGRFHHPVHRPWYAHCQHHV